MQKGKCDTKKFIDLPVAAEDTSGWGGGGWMTNACVTT